MVDILITDPITRAELADPKTRVEEAIDADLYTWIRTGFKGEFKKLMEARDKKSRDWHIGMATAQRGLTRALYCLHEVSELDEGKNRQVWHDAVREELFGRDPNSVVRSVGITDKEYVIAHLKGPISALTLVDLIISARPELEGNLNMGQIVSGPEADIDYKVDFTFDFGDTNMYGRKVLRLVQLKSGINVTQAGIVQVDPENLNQVRYITQDDARKMLGLANVIQRGRPDVEVRSYAIQVPSFDSEAVGQNVFGIVSDTYKPDILKDFRSEAVRAEFLPPRQGGALK